MLISIAFVWVISVVDACFTYGGSKRGRNVKPNGEIVFIGDSITDWFMDDGRNVWDKYYGSLQAVNVGVAADGTQHTIDRLNNGLIDKFSSRLAVLKIGTNDLARGYNETYVSDQIGKIIRMVKERMREGGRILLLGILPRHGERIHQRIRNVNEMIQKYDDGHSVRFLNMESSFSSSLGQVHSQLYWPDKLHLSAQGYQVWADTMAPLFKEMYAA